MFRMIEPLPSGIDWSEPMPAELRDARILIVDDSAINRQFLLKSLQAKGFLQLKMAESGEEAVGFFDAWRPELVILDIMMPGMDGYQCCEAIRRHEGGRDVPILIQTVLTEPEQRYRAFTSGATDFIGKPLDANELFARARVHLMNRLCMKRLQLYKSRMDYELHSAQQLQHAILPPAYELEELRGRCQLDVAYHFESSSEIGGDFWGIKRLMSYQVAFWMADFSGHGVAAALNVFRLHAYLMEHSPFAMRPGDYLSSLNERLLPLLLRGQFATMFYGVLDLAVDRLFYASAGCPHPMLWHGAEKEITMIDGSGRPLGIGMHHYPTQSVDFRAGQALLLYSDGLTEALDEQGATASEAKLMKLLQGPVVSSHGKIAELVQALRQHQGDRLRDDLTLAFLSRRV